MDLTLPAVVAAVVTAIAAGAVAVIKARADRDRAKEKARADDRDTIIDRLEKQVERLGAQVAHLWEAEAECEVQLATLYGYAERYHDVAVRHTAALRKLGHDPGEVSPMPTRPARRSRAASPEFVDRTEAHIRGLIQSAGSAAPPPGGPQP